MWQNKSKCLCGGKSNNDRARSLQIWQERNTTKAARASASQQPPTMSEHLLQLLLPPNGHSRTVFPPSTSPALPLFYKALAIYYDKSPEGKSKHSTLGEKQRASTPR
jgi:hypothetical protein